MKNGRAGRNFRHRYGSSIFFGDGGDARANPLGDGVALVGALSFADEVHLDVGDVRAASQEGVAHEAVEIKRRSCAGVDLVIADFGLGT